MHDWRELSISNAPPDGLTKHDDDALRIRGTTAIESKALLIQIPEQMERIYTHISSADVRFNRLQNFPCPLALARNDPRLLGKTDHVIVRGDF